MRLVPRQLQRAGMTGTVPYYGGRLAPAQAYAAAHPTRAEVPAAVVSATVGAAQPVPSVGSALATLQRLADSGAITPQEYAELKARILA